MNKREMLSKIKAMFEEVGDVVELPNGEYEQPNGDIWVVEDGKIVEIKKAEETPAEEPAAEMAEEQTEEQTVEPAEAPAEETPEEAPAEVEEQVEEAIDEVAQLKQIIEEQAQQIAALNEAIRALQDDGENFKAQFKAMQHKPSAQPVAFSAEKTDETIAEKMANLRKMYRK